LTFDPAARTYLPALKVGAMGAWLSDSLFSGGRLTAAVKDLQQQTGETVCVTGVNDLHCEIIYGLSSSTRPSHLHTGAACPLVLSALGRVWLSRHPDELIERVYRRSAASGLFNRGAALTLHAFMDVVTPLREMEVACLEDTWPEPARSRPTTVFATDVPTFGAQRRLVLGVVGPTDRIVPKLATIREAIGMWRVKLEVPETTKKDVFQTH
jgi:DNA-binding IclR family transcriptional regulator